MLRSTVLGLVTGAWLVTSSAARADVTIQSLTRAQAVSGVRAGIASGVLGRPELSAIVELPEGEQTSDVQRVGTHFGVARGSLADLTALGVAHPAWRLTWSAPLRPLLDRVAMWTGAPTFRNTTGLTGRDALVGIVDTGADITHPDLQNEDGSTRIVYFIDYSRGPAGLQQDAESQCSGKLPCAVYAAKDIDALVSRHRTESIPPDTIGHGTHVASLAAGNGGAEKRYVGIAPEASLIIARVLDASNQISDATVLSAANLIFYLADQLGKPAVVNLSLGSNFGPHDGTSALERGLASLVGDEHPGHAIVVAAGNSAGQFEGNLGYPAPLGVHTDVSVPSGASVVVPILAPAAPSAGDTVSGSIFVWASFRPDDDIAIAVERGGEELAPLQHLGQGGTFGTEGELTATVVVGSVSKLGLGVRDENAAAVIIEGTWPKDQTFSLRLEGKGTVNLWADGAGDVGPDGGSVGALFPASTKESTMTIPAGHPDLISVGATLNRTTWTDRLGDEITVNTFGSTKDSAARLRRVLQLRGTDDGPPHEAGHPRAGRVRRRRDERRCRSPEEPDEHLLRSGHVQPRSRLCRRRRDPRGDVGHLHGRAHHHRRARSALRAKSGPDRATGAHAPPGRRPAAARPRALRLAGGRWCARLTGHAGRRGRGGEPIVREPVAAQSFLSVGATYAHPDPSWSVPVLLKLRDGNGKIADGFDAKKLRLDVKPGTVVDGLTRAAPGLYRATVAAERNSGGDALSITARYDGKLLAAESMPIAVDVSTARQGFAARGGCSVTQADADGARSLCLAAIALTALQSRRCRRAVRTARSPGRRGTSDRDRPG